MEESPFAPEDWMLHELTHHNVKVNKTSFPKESREVVFAALDAVLDLAVSIPQEDPLAFASYAAFVLFPILILRSLPPRCNGKHVAQAFAKRCSMLLEGHVDALLRDAHGSQVTRLACRVHALTQPSQSFPLTARAAALAGCGAVGKACKLAFFLRHRV
jgi:hypothetical protein